MKPIIGLTSQFEHQVNRKLTRLNYTYVNAVIKAGGIPIIIPILDDTEELDKYLDLVDGLIFTGGEDVSSFYFDEEPLKEVTTICAARDKMELDLFEKAYERKIPLLGICRGLQIFNIALGGNIYQDIPRQVPNAIGHLCVHNVHQGYHSINIVEGTEMFNIFEKEKLAVNSVHHQSIKDLGKNLKVSSTAPDGVIESIESTTDQVLLGVQFHPEAMMTHNEEYKKIFDYFIEKCKDESKAFA